MNKYIPTLSGLVAGALALILTPSCALEQATPASSEAAVAREAQEGAILWAAVWTLTWDKSRLEPAAAGAWSVKTDLNYRVELLSGWIVDHSVSFGPCDPGSTSGAGGSGGGSSALRLFGLGVREARAHEDSDPSAIESMYAEDLTKLEDAGPWPTTFAPVRYCRAHWLVGRATSALQGATEAAPQIDGRSVRLAGKWERNGTSGSFEVDTWWPEGNLQDLEDLIDPAALAKAQADGGSFAARVSVKRDIGAVFDGIDFETAHQALLDGLVVENLAKNAEMDVELFRPDT